MVLLKNIKILLSLAILLATNILFAGCNDYTVKTDSHLNTLVEKSFETTAGKDFVLNAAFGDVFIETSDSPTVSIRILGNKETKKKVNFDFENTDEGITVKAEKKDSWNFFNFWNHMKLKFQVTLPKNYNAKISSSGGDVYIRNLDGQISTKTSGGDVSIKDVNGSLMVQTSGGDVTIENINGNSHLTTSGGDIKAASFNGNLEASTSGGDVTLSGSNGKIKASTSGGEVALDYSGKNEGIDLYSSGGDINLLLPADFNADAKLSTSGGSIQCKFKINNAENVTSSKLEGQLNQGGLPVIIKTSGGDITVKQK